MTSTESRYSTFGPKFLAVYWTVLLLLTFVGRATFLHLDRPQALAWCLQVKLWHVLPTWNQTFGLPDAINFRHPIHQKILSIFWWATSKFASGHHYHYPHARDILLLWIGLQPSYRRILKTQFIYLFALEIKNSTQNIAVNRLKSASLEATWLNMYTPVTPLLPVALDVIKETRTKSDCHVSLNIYCSNLLSFFLRCGTQWDLNSLV